MPYLILQGSQDDKSDVTTVKNPDMFTMIFTSAHEAKEWAEDNLNTWYKVVSI